MSFVAQRGTGQGIVYYRAKLNGNVVRMEIGHIKYKKTAGSLAAPVSTIMKAKYTPSFLLLYKLLQIASYSSSLRLAICFMKKYEEDMVAKPQ